MGHLKPRWLFLLRVPSTQEDEGRFELMGSFKTMSELDAARTEIVQKSKGYFTDGDFVITQEIHIPDTPRVRLSTKENPDAKGSNHDG